MRIKWYESPDGKTFRDYALAGSGEFPDVDIPSGLIQIDPYESDEPPVFFGHYWLTNERPELLASNVACLDYSVAKKGEHCVRTAGTERASCQTTTLLLLRRIGDNGGSL